MVRGFVPEPSPLTAVMTISPLAPPVPNARAARSFFRRTFVALIACFIGLSLPVATGRAQSSDHETEGEEVLTRGPVHEAFAPVVSYNPAPGIVVQARPPGLIEELPPEEKPEGDDVAWIPGYWGWDNERNDFLWISGTWRILPPGRAWMAGYWRESDGGYQWISGYWADATESETTYLPPPPATLEEGPNGDAPSDDYGWSPGCWIWQQDRYAWRAGYWAEGRADWMWSPAYYVWTPRGAVYVGGYWDYPVERRGILFAPVYYQSHGYARRGYTYSPRIAINLALFQDNLFLRPSYHHYYFGDYYGSRYEQDGFFASISFQSRRQGFEPFYAYNRWEHRSDRGWVQRYQASYQDRRVNEAARPPRTWAAQVRVNAGTNGSQVSLQLVLPLAQLARRPDNPVHFQPVAPKERQNLAQRGREVQAARDQRRTVEAKVAPFSARKGGGAPAPVRVATPRSPIVAPASGPQGRNQPPRQAPQTNSPVSLPKAENPGRAPSPDRRNAPAESRPTEPPRNSPAQSRPNESTRPAPPDAEKRDREAEASSRQKGNESAAANRQQAEERAKAVEDAKARDQSPRQTQAAQPQARSDADRRRRDEPQNSPAADKSRQPAVERTNVPPPKSREETRSNPNESADRDRQKAEPANGPAVKPREESPRPASEARGRQPDEPKRAREEPARANPTSKDQTPDDENDDAKKDKPRGR